ncbi:hypothetical protein OUZ56_022335 [Daphnia magna]|uniref:Uncharacterized protein n=1 Tax=Daphnia magna TaxID=35525 RepID=A0ABR0AW56_9CRUS|nr:hypothetical protein OUZ56_022335 [Daphnia magna]
MVLEQVITWSWSVNLGLDLSSVGPTILFPQLSLEFWDGSCCCRTLLGSLVRFQKAAFQEQEYNLPAVNTI